MACTNCDSNSQIKISGMFYCASCGKKIEKNDVKITKNIPGLTETNKSENDVKKALEKYDLLSLLSSINSPDNQSKNENIQDKLNIEVMSDKKEFKSLDELITNSVFPKIVSEKDEKAYEFYANNFLDKNKINSEPIPIPTPLDFKNIPFQISTEETTQKTEPKNISLDYNHNLQKENVDKLTYKKPHKSLTDLQDNNETEPKTEKIQDVDPNLVSKKTDYKNDEKNKNKPKKFFLFSCCKIKNNNKKNHHKYGLKKIIIILILTLMLGLIFIFAIKFIENYKYGRIPIYDINKSLNNANFKVNLPASLPKGYREKTTINTEEEFKIIFSYDPHYKNDYFNITYLQKKTNLSKEQLSDSIKGSKEWTSEIDKETGIEFIYTNQKIEWIHDNFYYKIMANELSMHEFIKIAKSVKY